MGTEAETHKQASDGIYRREALLIQQRILKFLIRIRVFENGWVRGSSPLLEDDSLFEGEEKEFRQGFQSFSFFFILSEKKFSASAFLSSEWWWRKKFPCGGKFIFTRQWNEFILRQGVVIVFRAPLTTPHPIVSSEKFLIHHSVPLFTIQRKRH